MTMVPFLEGMALSGGLIIAIGAQNAYLLSLGIKRNHHFAAATVCAFWDMTLITLGVLGVGAWVQANPAVLKYILWGGALFLTAYGARALRSAGKGRVLEPRDEKGASGFKSLRNVVLTTAAISVLNPHVYLDTIVLLGSISGRYQGIGRYLFGIGAATASVLWFYSLGFAGQLLAPFFAKPTAWRILDVLICLTMWSIAAKLILQAVGY
ncbi:MAG: LysE/ArgO family amino acid transporter [Pseudomonadota bacterium]